MQLAKAMSQDVARSLLGGALKEALAGGRRLVLQLGASPPNLRRYCDSQMPIEAFDYEKTGEVAKGLGMAVDEASFQMVILVDMSKAKAEKALPQVLPGFDEMAVMLVDDSSLPAGSQLEEAGQQATSLRSALSLLALEVAKPAAPAEGSATAPVEDSDTVINDVDFEYVEKFGDHWQERWPLPQNTRADG